MKETGSLIALVLLRAVIMLLTSVGEWAEVVRKSHERHRPHIPSWMFYQTEVPCY